MALRDGDVSVLAVPASHVTGLVAIILTMLRVGGTHRADAGLQGAQLLEIAARERDDAHADGAGDVQSLPARSGFRARSICRAWRIGGFGGAPMPQATIARARRRAAAPHAGQRLWLDRDDLAGRRCCRSAKPRRAPTRVGKAVPCADIDRDGRRRPRGGARRERRAVDRRADGRAGLLAQPGGRPQRRSAAATGNPATSARSTRRATCACSTARRT